MPKQKTVIIARTNAVLVTNAFDLIKRGCQVQIIGKEIAMRLKEVVGDVLQHRRHASIDEFQVLLKAWIDRVRTRLDNNTSMNEETKVEILSESEENYSCLNVISQNSDSLQEVIEKIDRFFVDSGSITDDPNTITLVTAHRSKGSEYECVVILRPDLFPHPSAKRQEDKIQEENAWYVACTRAIDKLVVCNDDRPE